MSLVARLDTRNGEVFTNSPSGLVSECRLREAAVDIVSTACRERCARRGKECYEACHLVNIAEPPDRQHLAMGSPAYAGMDP